MFCICKQVDEVKGVYYRNITQFFELLNYLSKHNHGDLSSKNICNNPLAVNWITFTCKFGESKKLRGILLNH